MSLSGWYYLGFPLEALLYEANVGITHSRKLVLGFAASRLERGDPLPEEIAVHVGRRLRRVLDGDEAPGEMFNPEGKRGEAIDPLPESMLELLDLGDGDIHEKFAMIGETLHQSAERVRDRYYKTRAYGERLRRTQALLDEMTAGPSAVRMAEIAAELRVTYESFRTSREKPGKT